MAIPEMSNEYPGIVECIKPIDSLGKKALLPPIGNGFISSLPPHIPGCEELYLLRSRIKAPSSPSIVAILVSLHDETTEKVSRL